MFHLERKYDTQKSVPLRAYCSIKECSLKSVRSVLKIFNMKIRITAEASRYGIFRNSQKIQILWNGFLLLQILIFWSVENSGWNVTMFCANFSVRAREIMKICAEIFESASAQPIFDYLSNTYTWWSDLFLTHALSLSPMMCFTRIFKSHRHPLYVTL